MLLFTIIVGLFGIAGGIFGMLSFFYARRQTELARHQTEMMEGDINDRKKQYAEDDQRAQRFGALSTKLRRINPRLQVQEPSVLGTTWIYTAMYPDPRFRVDVENYIVQLDLAATIFSPRKPQLMNVGQSECGKQ
ncbi:MAG: hypothetical protein WBQ89_20160 [Candidatus Acidiferrum sp.]